VAQLHAPLLFVRQDGSEWMKTIRPGELMQRRRRGFERAL
jgi:hypothetical protein